MEKLTIPALLDKAIVTILERVGKRLASQYESWVSQDEIVAEAVEHRCRDGFIPFTNGGYVLNVPLCLSISYSSGRYFNDEIKTYADKQQEDCLDMFCHDFDIDKERVWELMDNDQSLKESFWDYENEWMIQPYYLILRAVYYKSDNWRNKTGKDCIVFDLAYNMSEYCDERGAKNVFSETVLVESLSIPVIKGIKDKLLAFV